MGKPTATLGHTDARYWVWKTDGGSEEEFLAIHKAGSIQARLRVLRHFMEDICDTSWDAHVQIIQEHNRDPKSYIYGASAFDDARIQEIADSFDKGVEQIKEHRRSTCPE